MTQYKKHPDIQTIIFSSDGFRLKGTLHLPAAVRPPVVIGSHGLLSSGNSPKQVELARRCNENGIAFFRFDHRGIGVSEGVFENVTSLEGRCHDLISAIQTVKDRNDIGDRIGLFGSSMGGAVCLTVAGIMDIRALVTFAAPVRSSTIHDVPEGAGQPTSLGLSFRAKNLRFDISDRLSAVHHVLICHGDADTVVPPSDALEIFERAREPKKMIMQQHGDHLMSDTEHQKEFIQEACAWFRTHLYR
jgi:alpha-beta hydrolase superfamily lysophospholipase